MNYFKLINRLIVLFIFTGCLFDGGSKRKIVGEYYLHRWEGGAPFYIVDIWGKTEGGGLIKGTVKEIGWNNDYIFVSRKSTFGGDPDGWMIIYVSEDKITGPFTAVQFERERKLLLGNQSIKIFEPDKIWEMLK
ncbi:MAG: hypothetical protein IPM91_18985 [Bacteroidetes bacterium]|nr:hypothetical protein [Bacteroidota bacterium]